jgi:hypothetical protein
LKKIIVVGYPKSGNTWATRLVAQLVECPVEGFLYSDHKEPAIEGSERASVHRVFKSHHQLHEIKSEDVQNAKIIYLLRDPRDVAISGRNYFTTVSGFKSVKLKEGSIVYRVFKKTYQLYARFVDAFRLRKEMNKAVLQGNKLIHHWCRVSWKKHVEPYMKNDSFLKVRYEDLLSNTHNEAKRILHYLGLEKDGNSIRVAIEKQSFENRKNEFIKMGMKNEAEFLRKGKAQQWKVELGPEENQLFVAAFKNELEHFGYELY